MDTFLIKAAQLVLALALLVTVHELGHYIFARIFGIKVNRFYLFFNPGFSLLKYYPSEGRMELIAWTKKTKGAEGQPESEEPRALLSFKCGRKFSPVNRKGRPSWAATLYGIGWLPLGGYCAIDGMVDETTSADKLAAEAKPHEFRAKPSWQRLLVMTGGVLFNFILAILIYAGMAFWWGDKYVPFNNITEGMDFVPAAVEVGFRNGDIPIAADGRRVDGSAGDDMFDIAQAKVVTVLRNHTDTVDIAIPDDFLLKLNAQKGFMTPRVPVYIERLVGGEPAAKAGLAEGDHIIAIDTVATPSFTELTATLKKYAGKATTVTIERDGKPLTVAITPTEGGKLGFQLRPLTDIYETVTVRYNLLQSFPKGIENGTGMLSNYVSSMRHVFSKEGAESLGGFGTLGSMFPDSWNWWSFWYVTAFLSVALAFMNIIPIPGLDGGHVLFLLIEMVSRRKPSDKFIEYANMVGFFFLLLLLIYANGNDIFRTFIK